MSDLPEGWAEARISDIGNVYSGGTPSTKVPEYWGGDIVWFSPADLTGYAQKTIREGAKKITRNGLENSSAVLMPPGTVIFSSRAPIGYVAITETEAATNQGFKSVHPHEGVSADYVYYYLKSAKRLAEERASGTTFLELSGKAFAALPIPLPPLNEQRRIVAKIEALFSRLEEGASALKEARARLALYRQSLLKAAFEGRPTETWRRENPHLIEPPETLLSRIRAEREAAYKKALADWQEAVKRWQAEGGKGKKPRKPGKPSDNSFSASTNESGWVVLNLGSLIGEVQQGWSPKCDDNACVGADDWAIVKNDCGAAGPLRRHGDQTASENP